MNDGPANPDHAHSKDDSLELTGENLNLDRLVEVARGGRRIRISPAARERVEAVRAELVKRVEAYKKSKSDYEAGAERPPATDYGVTTGFGEFKNIPIDPDELEELQRKILLSHAVGVGQTSDFRAPSNYFSAEVVRATMLLRLSTFLMGHSAASWELVDTVCRMINAGVVPLVPTRGSVGSSGDLAPLVHLFGVLLGSGFFYLATTPETIAAGPDFETHLDESSPDIDERQLPERVVLSAECLQRALSLAWEAAKERAAEDDPIRRTQTSPKLLTLSYKEGLALTNGATVSAALLALAVHDAETLASAADIALAMTAEAMCGCGRAFDEKVHRLRRQRGQIDCAANVRAVLDGSKLLERAGAVQDPYSIRCAPAVHGASRDTISYARMVIDQEIRAGIDNPIFFFEGLGVVTGDGRKWDTEFDANWPTQPTRDGGGEVAYAGHKKESFSAGNFHGQPVGLAADYLAIALAELANISERRTQLLLDRNHNRGLPGNLIPEAGVNSGYMLAQYCAAGLVSENKVLAHPASVDSIPTSANTEDHVAMATIA